VSALEQLLDKSLTAEVLAKIERGEPVDFPQLVLRQTLQIARIGELHALDAIRRTKEADNGTIVIG
jgi:hypothetical protein